MWKNRFWLALVGLCAAGACAFAVGSFPRIRQSTAKIASAAILRVRFIPSSPRSACNVNFVLRCSPQCLWPGVASFRKTLGL